MKPEGFNVHHLQSIWWITNATIRTNYPSGVEYEERRVLTRRIMNHRPNTVRGRMIAKEPIFFRTEREKVKHKGSKARRKKEENQIPEGYHVHHLQSIWGITNATIRTNYL